MKSIYNLLIILSLIILSMSGSFAQQGKKSASLDNDDLSPLARTIETLNAGVSGWAPLTPEDSGFTVLLPGSVTVDVRTLPSGTGTATIHSFRGEIGGRKYEASFTDYSFQVDESMADAGFEGIRARIAANADMIEETRIKFGTHPGRQMVIAQDKDRIYMRYYLIGSRCYGLIADNGKDQKQTEESKKFMDSFKLVDR